MLAAFSVRHYTLCVPLPCLCMKVVKYWFSLEWYSELHLHSKFQTACTGFSMQLHTRHFCCDLPITISLTLRRSHNTMLFTVFLTETYDNQSMQHTDHVSDAYNFWEIQQKQLRTPLLALAAGPRLHPLMSPALDSSQCRSLSTPAWHSLVWCMTLSRLHKCPNK